MNKSFKPLLTAMLLNSFCLFAADAPMFLDFDLSGNKMPTGITFKAGVQKKWTVSDGVLHGPDYSKCGISGFTIGADDWSDYDISFRIRKLTANKKDQHFGFRLRNGICQLYLRENGFYIMIPTLKMHQRIGKNFASPMEVGKNAKWVDMSISLKGADLKIWVDGNLTVNCNKIPIGNGKFTFYSYQNQVELTRISANVLKTDVKCVKMDSCNMAMNASFEQCTLDTLPDYWGVSHWGIGYDVMKNHADWVKRFKSTADCAYEGKRSLYINNPKNGPAESAYNAWSCNFGMVATTTYTLSAYMKAEKPGMKIQMGNYRGMSKAFELTTEWKRYEMILQRGPNGLYGDMLSFKPLNQGGYWIDAVQLEKGEKASVFQMANADKHLLVHEGNAEKQIFEVPVHQTQYVKTAPDLNGDLSDSVWAKTKFVELKHPNGNTPKEKTLAKYLYTDDGIYIGIDAQEANSDQIKCRCTKHDDYVWGDPSIEMFIDSKLTRGTYHQLGFNVDGVQYDNSLGNANWDGRWQVKTTRKSDNSGWTAEVFLPFADFAIDKSNGNKWGFNLCRNNPREKEISTWAPTYGGFHVPLRFGQLVIRTDIQKKYILGTKDFELKFIGKNKYELSALAFNNTGVEFRGKVICSEKSGKFCFEKKIVLSDKAEQRLVFGTVNSDAARIEINSVMESLGKIVAGTKTTVTQASLLNILTQFNYCTTELEMPLRITLALNSAMLSKSEIELSVIGNKAIVFSETIKPEKDQFAKILPVEKWANDTYKVVCRLKVAGVDVSSDEISFRKLPPSDNEVKIDRFRRAFVVNGKCFLPVGFFWEGMATPELIEFLAKNGANFLHSYSSISDAALEAARKNGVMFEIDVRCRNGKTAETINKYKQSPAMLAWYTYDEAFTTQWGRTNKKKILADIQIAAETDPYRPVILLENSHGMNYIIQEGFRYPGDVPMLDYYAWPPSGNVQLWNGYSKDLMKLGEKEGRPAFAVPLVSGYGFHASRDILPQDNEYQTYVCLINGCRGIAYWANFPKATSSFTKIKQLFAEIKQLQEPLFSLEKVPEIKCTSPDIRYTLKKFDGAYYLITVNDSKSDSVVRFDLSRLPGIKTAEVMFEDRNIVSKNGVIEDPYIGLQRHVYKLKNVK